MNSSACSLNRHTGRSSRIAWPQGRRIRRELSHPSPPTATQRTPITRPRMPPALVTHKRIFDPDPSRLHQFVNPAHLTPPSQATQGARSPNSEPHRQTDAQGAQSGPVDKVLGQQADPQSGKNFTTTVRVPPKHHRRSGEKSSPHHRRATHDRHDAKGHKADPPIKV